MKAGQYEALASRTEAPASDLLLGRVYTVDLEGGVQLDRMVSADLLHAILGVTGEVSELMRLDPSVADGMVQALKELGDIWWYTRMIPRCFGFDIGRFVELTESMYLELEDEQFMIPTDRLTEPMKKWFFYGKPINAEEIINAAAEVIAQATFVFAKTSESLDEDGRREQFQKATKGAWTMNIEKLRRRYPMAFDQVLAQEHDGQ